MANSSNAGRKTEEPSDNRPKKKPRRGGALARVGKILGTVLLVGALTATIGLLFFAGYVKAVILPQTDLRLESFNMDLTTTMYYLDSQTGEKIEMRTLHGDENRVWVDYDEIPQYLRDATIAIEDKRFYEHNGVDWIRTGRSVLDMFTGGKLQGGSTLTQQLIKNLTEEDDVTVKRKITEIFRALELDKNYSKETILEWYLNYIFLGEMCNGVYTASYNYFGKHVSELSLAECASLIAITNNPSLYNPYTNPQGNQNRQRLILDAMLDQGRITKAEFDGAIAEIDAGMNFLRGEGEKREASVYTWYEDQVINEVIRDLAQTFGISTEAAAMRVYSGGLSIITPFDPKIQAAVDAVYNNRDSLNYYSSSGQPLQSAITIIDNTTGYVVALSGGIGEKDRSRIFNRAADTVRPPGSAIKPVAVYAPAFEMGLITPATVVEDMPYQIMGGSPWPINSYGHYRGRMTVYEAVEDSSNPAAVRVASDYITPRVAYDFMVGRLGFTSLVEAEEIGGEAYTDIVPGAMALGGLTKGVSTYQMAAAYASFARSGIYTKPSCYLQVLDSEGKVILDSTADADSVAMKESTAWYINYLLKNVVRNGTGTGANFSGTTIAGKTGTTSSRKDLWFVGYTSYYTAAVWTGYDQQERLASSLYNPSPGLWRKVMSVIHEDLENRDFAKPGGVDVISASYCRDSGLLPTEYCKSDPRGSRVVSGSFLRGDAPSTSCDLHVAVEVCTASPILDANGEPTGLYHMVGEFCPHDDIGVEGQPGYVAATVSQSVVLDFVRTKVRESIVVRDDAYLKSHLEAAGTCKVHTGAIPEPPPIDPEDPDPFDPENPEDPYDPENPTDPNDPDPGGQPQESPDPEATPVIDPDMDYFPQTG